MQNSRPFERNSGGSGWNKTLCLPLPSLIRRRVAVGDGWGWRACPPSPPWTDSRMQGASGTRMSTMRLVVATVGGIVGLHISAAAPLLGRAAAAGGGAEEGEAHRPQGDCGHQGEKNTFHGLCFLGMLAQCRHTATPATESVRIGGFEDRHSAHRRARRQGEPRPQAEANTRKRARPARRPFSRSETAATCLSGQIPR